MIDRTLRQIPQCSLVVHCIPLESLFPVDELDDFCVLAGTLVPQRKNFRGGVAGKADKLGRQVSLLTW